MRLLRCASEKRNRLEMRFSQSGGYSLDGKRIEDDGFFEKRKSGKTGFRQSSRYINYR